MMWQIARPLNDPDWLRASRVFLLLAWSAACSSSPPADDVSSTTLNNTASGGSITAASSADSSVTTGAGGTTAASATTGGLATSNSASAVGVTGIGGSAAVSGGGQTTGSTVAGGGDTTAGSTMTASATTGGGTVTFSTPEGTIPNEPQPDSTVDLPVDGWQDGLISPTLLQGHQVNQPAVANGYLVVGGNEEFWIYDISDPTSPQLLSDFATPNATGGEAESHALSFARYGDNLYMVTIGGRGIDTWDITDARAPKHLAQIQIPGTNYGDYTEAIWGVTWQGQYIYVGATNNGIKVVDAANPASLEIAGEISASQYGGVSAGPLDAVGNILVVMTPKESGGVATLDISDPTKPSRLASFSTGISYIGQFYRRWAFLLSPIRAWDVLTDPRNIGTGSSPVGTLNHEVAEYITFSDGYMFLGHARAEIGGTPGSSKIDVANPQNMRHESNVWGRQNLGGKNDDQFNLPIGNLLVIGDDQSPYHGWVFGVHQTDPDTTPPVIDTVIPKDQETGVATTARVGVTFSDNIEVATVNAASFIVRPVGGAPLSGKYGVRMGVVNFDPDEDLQPGTSYEVVLPVGGITDFVGNTLSTEWVSTFTTN